MGTFDTLFTHLVTVVVVHCSTAAKKIVGNDPKCHSNFAEETVRGGKTRRGKVATTTSKKSEISFPLQ